MQHTGAVTQRVHSSFQISIQISSRGDEEDDYGMPLESFDYRGDEETPTKKSPVNDYADDIFVWNPFTGVYRKLPDPEDMSDDDEMCRAYGFGYDSAADDYKVFMVAVERYVPIEDRVPMVQIFSLKIGSWRRVENPDRCLQYISGADRGLLLKGALHWIKKHAEKITAFDLGEEKFYDVPAPPEQRFLAHKGIGIVGEYLCMWTPTPSFNGSVVCVMKEYLNEKSWILYRIRRMRGT
ncbi:hypothetical protein Tsubulata_006876 [Turnera subulata]|uniref:F-box associated beta-propeller type 1 domain-containing protein n=1 Tax=Turnera subulata TaxID=218843 RepID=A0A9Q0JLY7_9ROSI|nr:hypothetical protein Tsubulata_006876 [Turnera subulata]